MVTAGLALPLGQILIDMGLMDKGELNGAPAKSQAFFSCPGFVFAGRPDASNVASSSAATGRLK